jgi:hypothetical protein
MTICKGNKHRKGTIVLQLCTGFVHQFLCDTPITLMDFVKFNSRKM